MDETIICNLVIEEESQKAVIRGLKEDNFEIDISSDIDFTGLVSILTEKIDDLRPIELNCDSEPEDEKLKLITNTIKEIFESYNNSLIEANEEFEENNLNETLG
jgi:hypothetical protein